MLLRVAARPIFNFTRHFSMATNSDPVVISGGGLAGALMAVFMAKKGHKVDVFEMRPDMRKETISAGRSINLAMSVRGLTALKEVGIADEIMEIAIPMRGRMVHPLNGEVNFQPYSPDFENVCLYSVSRGILNMKLMTIAEQTNGVTFHFNQKCSSLNTKSTEATFTDMHTNETTHVKAKTIIGCDGAFSAVRYNMMRRDRYEYSQSFIEHSYKELHIPPGPNGEHVLRKECLHIWPRGSYMMIALPNIDGSFTCTLFFPLEGITLTISSAPLLLLLTYLQERIASLPSTLKRKLKSFLKSSSQMRIPTLFRCILELRFDYVSVPLMPTYLDDFFANPTGSLVTIRYDIASPFQSYLLRAFPWVVGDSVALVGDAAHAIVPFYGQGMNAAFESCQELSRLIDKYDMP